MRGDVQDQRPFDLFQRLRSCLLPGQNLRIREERLNAPSFLRRTTERSKVHAGEVAGRGDAPAPVRGREGFYVFRKNASCVSCPGLAKRWIGNYKRPAFAGPRNLHAQQVATAGEIADGVTLHQVVTLLITESLDRHKAQIAIRRNQQLRCVAQQRTNGPEKLLVSGAREL